MSTEGRVITCKAAVAHTLSLPLTVETVNVLPPTPGHVRVKMVATALCHSDDSVFNGSFPMHKVPYIPGHEGGGIVESVGEGVTSVKKGDKVFTLFFPHCGECPTCLGDKTNICLDIRRKVPPLAPFLRCEGLDGLTSFTSSDGKPIYHGFGCSSFSEYTVVPANSCVKVDPQADLTKACVMACGFLTGYGSSANAVQIKEGDKVAVWGLGGVGLACIVGCHQKKASQIIGIDLVDSKKDIAKKCGMTDFVSIKSLQSSNVPIKKKILELTQMGLDYAFVCVGNAKVMEEAITCLGLGGTAVLVGLAKEGDKVSFNPLSVLASQKIVGTIYGDYNIFEDVPKLVKRYVNGELPVNDFVTNVFKLEDINKAFDVLKTGEGIRSVIEF